MSDSSPQELKPKTGRLSPTLPLYTRKRLFRWAFVEGVESAATQMALTTKARTDANRELIDSKLEFYAKEYGLTLEQLDQKLDDYEAQGLRLPAIHKLLEAEALEKGLKVNRNSTELDLEIEP